MFLIDKDKLIPRKHKLLRRTELQVFSGLPEPAHKFMAQSLNEDDHNFINSDQDMKLSSEQEESLIEHWDDAISLYKHIKEKFIEITNLSRHNKLRQQLREHTQYEDNYMNTLKKEQEIQSIQTQKSEWNYLIICTQQLLALNNENISYHLLAIQIYQAHPITFNENEQYNCNKDILCSPSQSPSRSGMYLDLAIDSCNSGINLSLIHLNGHHASFYIWITTFYVLKAQILFQQRKWKEVIECILPSLKYQQSDNLHLLYNLRASAYCELKQFHEAIAGKIIHVIYCR